MFDGSKGCNEGCFTARSSVVMRARCSLRGSTPRFPARSLPALVYWRTDRKGDPCREVICQITSNVSSNQRGENHTFSFEYYFPVLRRDPRGTECQRRVGDFG